MSLDEVIARDVEKVFLAGEGQGFDIEIELTPQGASKARKVRVLWTEGQDTLFYTNTDILDFNVNEIMISSADDVKGLVAPKSTGRDGQGDKVILPGSSSVWYVKKWLEDGRDSGTGMHRLVIADTLGILTTESI